MPIERAISACGSNGVAGSPGSGIQDTYAVGLFDDNCHQGGGSSTALSVNDMPPEITLTGASTVTFAAGTPYVELGATATDEKDGSLTPVITGTLNIYVPGTYTLTYTATDLGSIYTVNGVLTTFQAPQSVAVTRTIIVTGAVVLAGGIGATYTLPPAATPATPRAIVQNIIQNVGGGLTKANCSTWIGKNIEFGKRTNDPVEIQKLQEFLNKYQNANLKADGKYGMMSRNQVNKFQAKFHAEILKPKHLFGPTGNVMASTRAKMNAVACGLVK